MTEIPIAIIGTGMSGITAANTLHAVGRVVQLFDKSRGSGGRMASKRSAAGSLDIGAACFTATDTDFQQAVQQWQALGYVAPWPDEEAAIARWVGIPRMSALTRHLLGDLPVHFDCRITTVMAEAGGWYLTDTHDIRYGPFSQVIIAVPAPQAIPLLTTAPALAELSATITMAPVWAVALTFQQSLDLPPVIHPDADNDLAAVYCNSSKPQRSELPQTWVLQAKKEWSEAHQDDAPEQVIHDLYAAFTQMQRGLLPPPDMSLAHRWLYSQPLTQQNWGALSSADGLYVCGDWCLSGDVQGAWLSGRSAAKLLLSHQRN